MKIIEVKDKVMREEWVLPPFQREYVWNEEIKIREFLESVFYDWPIGSIILWTPDPKDEDVIKKRKLNTKTEGHPEYLREYIIDGQQRITTLMRALNNEPFHFKGKDTKVCFDFHSKKFIFLEMPTGNAVPLSEIIDLNHSEIKKKLNLTDLGDDIDDSIDRTKRMERYDVNIQRTPKGTTLKQAQELFIRLNTGGKHLPSVDLALAYISLLWDESRDELKKFKKSLEKTGFNFDFDLFVRCLSAVSLKQSLTKKVIKSFDANNVVDDWKKTKNGIEKTIDFLKTPLSLGSNIFLEAENTLVPIVFLFSEKEAETNNKMNMLAYWFLVSYMNQRFSGQSTSTLNKDINTIIDSKDPISGLIENLTNDKFFFTTKSDDIKGNQFKFILYCLYRDVKTTDFKSGFGIDNSMASPSNKLDFHHIFADSLLEETGFKNKKEDIANKTFLTNKTNKQLSNSDPTYLSQYPKNLLKAHLIPIDKNLWKLDNYEQFLQKRKELISNALNNFLSKLRRN